ncbi:YPDG domain-containing protein, partial [Corynebacterium kefirresidentii]|uniref:YPDG domain-containing protein n=1 Tax=Corynebacterium kefirresidentii TaxID=1979527 RepID=UPI001ABF0B54
MKIKSINGVTRRRGTTIAAAALSVALVTPFVHPVVNPGASPVAAAQDAATAQDRSVDSKGTSEATAIRADGTWGQKKGYQGTVYLDRDSNLQDQDKADKAMSGVKVFLQYVNGKGQVSPIYYTTSDSEGKFVFDLSNAPKDALGNPVEFKLSGDEKFQVRTWAENPDPAKYTLVGGGDMYSGRFHNRLTRKWETWDFTAGINRIVDSRVVFQERPNVDGWLAKPEAEWTEAPAADKKWPEGGNYGTARGKVWWENNEDEGTLSNQYFKDSSDRAATNVKVVGSYVNDEVARQFDAWKAANKNYSREQFRAAQKDIVDKYQAEHGAGSHIAESRVAYVKDDGSFYLPFAGLYGVDRNKKGNKTTDEEWGTLVSAKDEKHDSLMQWNGTLGQRHRHINKDYMYLYPVVGDNRDLWMGNYQDNMFQPADGGGLGESLESDNISQQNFALLTPRPMHDVFNYDNTSSIAAPGDTAKSKTTGLVPNQKYAIEWFADGKSTGKVCTVTANKLGELDSCDFTVPKDLSKATVYSSQVFAADASGNPTGTLLLADSFLADPTVVKDSESFAPEYKDGSGKPGDDATVPAPTIKDKDGKETTAPEGTKFALGDNAPEGVKVDPSTGEVTVPVPAGAKPGDKITVPVVVTYPDGSTDTVDVTVTVSEPDAPAVKDSESFAPEYKDGSGKPGDDATVPAPTIKDKDGKETTAPEGTKFAPGDNAPAGVKVDPDTGEIKVTVPADAKPGDKITVPVVVTYPDGSKDTVDVTVTVDKPDVPAPSIAAGSETDEVPA